jgi:hypothetical protein
LPFVCQLWEAALKGDKKTADVWYGFDNRRVWNKLLDEQLLALEFPRRIAKFSELPKLIRIWNSILDGESMVERDLASLRDFIRCCKGRGAEDLLDDLLVLKWSGPKEPQEVATPAACGAGFCPTDFTMRCVELWRGYHGTRYGIDLSRRKRRLVQPEKCWRGSFAEARRGVLRAAAKARAASIRRPRINPSEMTAYGVPMGVVQAEPGETMPGTVAWNEGLKKFHAATLKKRHLNMLSRDGRSSLPTWKIRPAYTGGEKQTSFSHVKNLAYLPSRVEEAANGAANGAEVSNYRERFGLHRCKEADMVVVDSLERFHATEAEEEWVVHVLYVVARGLLVTNLACANRVHGKVRRLKRDEVLEHCPGKELKTSFFFERAFKLSYPAVFTAVRGCCALTTSKWTITKEEFAAGAAANGARGGRQGHQSQLRVDSLGTLWKWLLTTRRLRNNKDAALSWRAGRPCPKG